MLIFMLDRLKFSEYGGLVCRGSEVWRAVYLFSIGSQSSIVVIVQGLAYSRLLEIYDYTDRKVRNDLHLFTAPKSPCSSDDRLRPLQD